MTRGRLVRRIAEEVLGREKASLVWSRLDVVGDIALIKMPLSGGIDIEDLRLIAYRILDEVPHVRSVWLATGAVEGDYRVRGGLVHLAGEKRTTTIYKEHGCKFKVDIARVFVTPRLNYEHLRVAKHVAPGEAVINMFAGAGLFSIIIACKSRPSVIHSIDINRHAYELIIENARLNRVDHIVRAYHGDAASIVEELLINSSDRVLMPLPALALEYLPHALAALRGGRGVVHVYLHVRVEKGKDPLEEAKDAVRARVEEEGWSVVETLARRVRSVGPRLVQVVVDAKVRKRGKASQ